MQRKNGLLESKPTRVPSWIIGIDAIPIANTNGNNATGNTP